MKSNRLKITLSIFSMLLCMSVYSQRQGGQRGGDRQGGQRGQKPTAAMILEKLDTNNDEVISKEEAAKDDRKEIYDNFAEIDSNEDGVIDLEELKESLKNKKRRRKPNAKKLIKQIDDNGDGTLNKLEVAAKENRLLSKNFDEIDTNEDGELDKGELKAFFAKNEKKRKKRRRRN